MARGHCISLDQTVKVGIGIVCAALLMVSVPGCGGGATQPPLAEVVLLPTDESSPATPFAAGYQDAQVHIFGTLAVLRSRSLRPLRQLSYELTDSESVLVWRCAEGRVRDGDTQTCGAFPVPAGTRGRFSLRVTYVTAAGVAGALAVPFDVNGRGVRLYVGLRAADDQVRLVRVVRVSEAPPGVQLQLDGDAFRLVNASAYDLVTEGSSGDVRYIPLPGASEAPCVVCGTGAVSPGRIVRRGESMTTSYPCSLSSLAGPYVAVVMVRLRPPGLPVAAQPSCDQSSCDTYEPIDHQERQQLELSAVWSEFQVNLRGEARATAPSTAFRDWLREPRVW